MRGISYKFYKLNINIHKTLDIPFHTFLNFDFSKRCNFAIIELRRRKREQKGACVSVICEGRKIGGKKYVCEEKISEILERDGKLA